MTDSLPFVISMIILKTTLLFFCHRPRRNGYGRSGIRNDTFMRLSLPSWAENIGEKEQNDIVMYAPWLDICNDEEEYSSQ